MIIKSYASNLARGNTCTQPILAGFPRWFCVEVKLLLESAEALGALDVEPQGKTTQNRNLGSASTLLLFGRNFARFC